MPACLNGISMDDVIERSRRYLLCNRSAGYEGNCPLFWKAGGCGYTPWIDEAERFDSETADSHIRTSYGSHYFVKVPVEVAERIAKRVVDAQELNAELEKSAAPSKEG